MIESDLIIVELCSPAHHNGTAQIPDAHSVPIDQLDSFLRQASHRSVFVFYDSATDPIAWSRVEAILNRYPIRYSFVLKGGFEAWLSRQQAKGMATAT